jgi:hypothetical protein
MPNLIWPRETRADVGASGLIGRTIHWLGVVVAAAVLVTALGFAVDGWALPSAGWMVAVAAAVALGARGVRYLLARE